MAEDGLALRLHQAQDLLQYQLGCTLHRAAGAQERALDKVTNHLPVLVDGIEHHTRVDVAAGSAASAATASTAAAAAGCPLVVLLLPLLIRQRRGITGDSAVV